MSDLFDLTGRSAVVTGSSRGIGLAIAQTLLSQGANVVINGYDEAETAATREALIAQWPSSPGHGDAKGDQPRMTAVVGGLLQEQVTASSRGQRDR